MKKSFIIMVIAAIVVITIGVIYDSLSQENRNLINNSLGIYTDEILVQDGNQSLPIKVSHKTYLFARNQLKRGDKMTLYYRAAGNKRLYYDPYDNELSYEIPKGGIKVSFIKIVESDCYSQNNPREP